MKKIEGFDPGKIGTFDQVIEGAKALKPGHHMRYTKEDGLYISNGAGIGNVKAAVGFNDAKITQLQKRDAASNVIFQAIANQYGQSVADKLKATYWKPVTPEGSKTGYVSLPKETLIEMDVKAKALKHDERIAAQKMQEQQKLQIAAQNTQTATDVLKAKLKPKAFEQAMKLVDMGEVTARFTEMLTSPPKGALTAKYIEDEFQTLQASLLGRLHDAFLAKGDKARANLAAAAIVGAYTDGVVRKDPNSAVGTFMRTNGEASKTLTPISAKAIASTVTSYAKSMTDIAKNSPTPMKYESDFARLLDAKPPEKAKHDAYAKTTIANFEGAMKAAFGSNADEARAKVAQMDKDGVAYLRGLALAAYNVAVAKHGLSPDLAKDLAINTLRDQFALRTLCPLSLAEAQKDQSLSEDARNTVLLLNKLVLTTVNGIDTSTNVKQVGLPQSVGDAQAKWVGQVDVFLKELLGPVPGDASVKGQSQGLQGAPPQPSTATNQPWVAVQRPQGIRQPPTVAIGQQNPFVQPNLVVQPTVITDVEIDALIADLEKMLQ
jgi:hypothetical protein